MKNRINENRKVTLTIGQLKGLVKEANFDKLYRIDAKNRERKDKAQDVARNNALKTISRIKTLDSRLAEYADSIDILNRTLESLSWKEEESIYKKACGDIHGYRIYSVHESGFEHGSPATFGAIEYHDHCFGYRESTSYHDNGYGVYRDVVAGKWFVDDGGQETVEKSDEEMLNYVMHRWHGKYMLEWYGAAVRWMKITDKIIDELPEDNEGVGECKLNEGKKVTLTIGQLKRLVGESYDEDDDMSMGDGLLHVFDYGEDCPFAERFVIILPSGDTYNASVDADMPNGVCMYDGETSYSTKMEMEDNLTVEWDGKEYTPTEVDDIKTLPNGVQRAIKRLMEEDGEDF